MRSQHIVSMRNKKNYKKYILLSVNFTKTVSELTECSVGPEPDESTELSA